MKDIMKKTAAFLVLVLIPLAAMAAPVTVNTGVVVNTNTCDEISWTDSSGLLRTGSIVKIDGNPNGYTGGYFSRLTYMDGASTVNINESNPAGDLSGLGFMVNHQPTGHAGRGWANSKQDGFNGTTTILFQGENHVIYQTEMDMYGDNGNTALGAWKVKWVYMIRTGNDYIVDSIAYDFSSKPFGTYGNDIRSPYCEVNWTGTGAANTLSESIDGIEFCASNNTGTSYIFKTNGSSPFSTGYTYNTPGRNIPYTLQWKNTPDREAGYVSTLDLTQQAAAGGYLSGPVNIGSTSASMPPNWAVNYQSNGFQGWYGDKMTWGLPYGAAGGETAAESGSTTKSTFPDWTWRKNWTAYPTIGFTLLIHMGKKTEDKVRALAAEQADIHELINPLTASVGTVVTTGHMNLYDAGGFTFKPAGFNHIYNAWEVVCASDTADISLNLGAKSLKNQTFLFDNYNAAFAPQITLNSSVLAEGIDMFTSVDTADKKLYVTLNKTITGVNHLVLGGASATLTPTNTIPAGATATPTNTPGSGGSDCLLFYIDRSLVPPMAIFKDLTLKIHVGNCSAVNVSVDGSPVVSSYDAGTGEVMFTTTGSDVRITRTGYTGGATLAVTKTTLLNDKKWAYSFTFDDGMPTCYSVVMPLFDSYGYKAAAALNTAQMQETAEYWPMSWQHADALRADGWSFFNHNATHAAATCSNIGTETVPVNELIEARWPDYKCTHFVYPYVDTTAWTCIRDSGLFLSAEVYDGINYADVTPSQPFLLHRYGFMAAGSLSSASLANSAADSAAADSRARWLIVFTHAVAPGSTTPPSTYDTNEAILEAHINYIYNTYGAGGADNMWFAPSDVVMHYLLTRDNAAVSYSGSCGTPTPTNTIPAGSTATNTYTATYTATATATLFACDFDNLDDGDNGNGYGGFWYTYSSGDPSLPLETKVWPGAACVPSLGGVNATAYAMRMTGTVGAIVAAENIYPCIGLGSQLNASAGSPAFTETDISSCTGIKFYTKGDGKSYFVKVSYTDNTGASLTGYDDYKYVFTAPASWTQLTIPFTMFAQAGWGTAADLAVVLAHAKEIQWQTNFNGALGAPASVDFWIDEVQLYGCGSCPAVQIATSTQTPEAETNTLTATNTAENTFTPTYTHTETDTNTQTHTSTVTNTPPTGSTNTYTETQTYTPTNTNTYTVTIPVSTYTNTLTQTNTPTRTNTPVLPTATYTMTYTYTYTVTVIPNTPTFTPTPLPTEADKMEIKNIFVYPHPYNPDKGNLRIRFTITKKADEINLKIYSASFRCIKEINLTDDIPAGEHTAEV
ncbi:MAG: CIA30 family protein, partial [Candidatus Goldbacteria bacterium]|nr:CIA30 family protein [Candidatus Goldiibacteriota bacterium]